MSKSTLVLLLGIVVACLMLVNKNAVAAEVCEDKKGLNEDCENNEECCSTRCDETTKKCLCSEQNQNCKKHDDCCGADITWTCRGSNKCGGRLK